VVAQAELIQTLEKYRWLDGRRLLAAEIEFLQGKHGDPEIDDWVILAPQLGAGGAGVAWDVADTEFSVHLRNRNENTKLVNAYAGPEDRKVAAVIAGTDRDSQATSKELQALCQPRRAVLLLYPIAHKKQPAAPWKPTMGFTMVLPPNRLRKQIGFSVKNPDKPDSVVVPA
jgi:hypothetical protein